MTQIQTAYPIVETSQVGHARRSAMALAQSLGFTEELAGSAGIIVTEISTNLIKHATNTGELFLRPIRSADCEGLEILSIDRGPGIPDIGSSMQDGVSTTKTSGIGLGGIRRLSHEFDISSNAGKGTVLVSRIWSRTPRTQRVHVGVVCTPAPGEDVSGDSWQVVCDKNICTVMVVDGLGHGALAHAAAVEAEMVFTSHLGESLPEILERTHNSLKKTRGAAVAYCRVDFHDSRAVFTGIGNISAAAVNQNQSRRMASMNGIVGHSFRSAKEFSYAFEPRSNLIMASDGLSTKWDLTPYPGLALKDPSVIAGTLYRDFKRGKDDTTVVVIREGGLVQ